MRRGRPSRVRVARALVLFTSLPLGAWTDPVQEMPLPVDAQVSILWRMWAFDRSHPQRSADQLVVGVAYQPGYRASVLAKDQFVQAVRAHEAGRGPDVRLVPIDVTRLEGVSDALRRAGVDILYVAPVRALDLRSLTAVTRARQILSCTGVPEYLDAGVAVGIDVRGGRPEILVNLGSAREEGARFSSEILRRARIRGEVR